MLFRECIRSSLSKSVIADESMSVEVDIGWTALLNPGHGLVRARSQVVPGCKVGGRPCLSLQGGFPRPTAIERGEPQTMSRRP